MEREEQWKEIGEPQFESSNPLLFPFPQLMEGTEIQLAFSMCSPSHEAPSAREGPCAISPSRAVRTFREQNCWEARADYFARAQG